jgi:hypothetical protein
MVAAPPVHAETPTSTLAYVHFRFGLLSVSFLLDHDHNVIIGDPGVSGLYFDLDSIAPHEILAGRVEQGDGWNFPGRARIRGRNVGHNDL